MLDGVQGIYRLLPVEDRDFDASTLVEGIAELVEVTQGELRSVALAVAQELGLPLPLDTLAKLVMDESVEIETRVRALDTVVRKTQDLVTLHPAAVCVITHPCTGGVQCQVPVGKCEPHQIHFGT